jgi:hypothetical protein
MSTTTTKVFRVRSKIDLPGSAGGRFFPAGQEEGYSRMAKFIEESSKLVEIVSFLA